MTTNYIYRIVKASGVSAGERVLIHFWGEDTEKDIANEFLAGIAALGATPVLLQQARSVNYRIFQNATDTCFDEAYFDAFSQFDAVLDVFACQPIVLGYSLDEPHAALYRRYISKLFYALMKAKRFAQIRIPTEANAAESGLEPRDYIRRMDQAYDIDYDALLSCCTARKETLSQAQRYVLRTGNECALCFDLTGRTWHIDAGDGDWPCGEVYIAPVESQTNGTVFFPQLCIEDLGVFSNVTLEIRDGMLSGSDQEAINAFIRQLAPEERVVCELGLGMNPGVTDLCGCTVLDEKMSGSFHIAIGANNMFGGRNEASKHIDLVNSGSFQLAPIQ